MTILNLSRDALLSSFSNLAYLDKTPESFDGWTKIDDIKFEKANGFFVVAYKKGTEIIIAFRGTDEIIKDGRADINLARGAWDPQFSDAAKFTSDLLNAYANEFKITVAGHSLGGGIGQIMGKMFNLGGASFDSPGATAVTQTREFAEQAALYGQKPDQPIPIAFINYMVNRSIVSSFGEHLGTVRAIDNLADPSLTPLLVGALSLILGPSALALLGLGLSGSLTSTHPVSGIERAMWASATLEAALDSGVLQMKSMPWTQATGLSWPVEGGPVPNVQVFVNSEGKVVALIDREASQWKIYTPDQSTIITLKSAQIAGDPLQCVLQQVNKPTVSCSMLLDQNNLLTVRMDSDGDHVTDRILMSRTANDGSLFEQIKNLSPTGELRDDTVTITSADGSRINITRDLNGDGYVDQSEFIASDARGNQSHSLKVGTPSGQLDEIAYYTDAESGVTEVRHFMNGSLDKQAFLSGEVTPELLDQISHTLPRDFRNFGQRQSEPFTSATLRRSDIDGFATQLTDKLFQVQLDTYLQINYLASIDSAGVVIPTLLNSAVLATVLQNELPAFVDNGRIDTWLNAQNELVIASANREVRISADGQIRRHYRSAESGEVLEQANSDGSLQMRASFGTRVTNGIQLPLTTTDYFENGQRTARLETLILPDNSRQSLLSLQTGKNTLQALYDQGQLVQVSGLVLDGVAVSDTAAAVLKDRLSNLSADELRTAMGDAKVFDGEGDLSVASQNVVVAGQAMQSLKSELVAGTDFYGKPRYISSKEAATQTLSNSVGSLIDSLSLVRAIQSGQPLPVIATGLRLTAGLDYLDGTRDLPNLGAAASVAGAMLSLYGLSQAIKNNDAIGAASAASYAVYGLAEAAQFLQTSGVIAQVPASLTAAGQTIGNALPYINLINSMAHGDGTGVAVAVVDLVMMKIIGLYDVPVVGWAYAVYSLVDALYTDVPDPWGQARMVWDGNNLRINSAGESGGNEAVRAVLDSVLANMNAMIERERAQNPGSQLGLIPARMPGLVLGMDGYRYTDIDANTGIEKNPALRFDTTGRPYNAAAGSVESYQSLIESIIRSGLTREAIAPMWEVETARMQMQAGDPKAGLREEERAGRDNLLAPASSSSVQIFRPVVLDLDGNGIATMARQNGVMFDIDHSGLQKQSGWINGNDGFLVLDRNYNGRIDSGREMFSNSDVALARRGLAGMAWVDANYDGRLDVRDPVWSQLSLWRDANVNAVQDEGEMHSLNELGVSELNFTMGTYTRNGQQAQLASPDLSADRDGLRISAVPQGILLQNSHDNKLTLLVTRIDDKTAVQANSDSVDGIEDVELLISGADLLANDSLGGFTGRTLTMTALNNFRHGSGWIDANGFVHFQPESNYDGKDAGFSYTATAVNGQTGSGQVDVALAGVNDAPTLAGVEHERRTIYGFEPIEQTPWEEFGGGGLYVSGGKPIYQPYTDYQEINGRLVAVSHNLAIASEDSGRGQLVGRDLDDPATSLSYSIVNQPQYGSVSINAQGQFTYTSWKAPGVASDYLVSNGQYGALKDGTLYTANNLRSPAVNPATDIFQVRITDPHGASQIASVTVPHYGPYLPPMPAGGGGKKPIAIDLGGDGFSFVNVDDSTIFFDVTGDGWKRRTSWIGKNDGLLAYDMDGDGKIDKLGEISFAAYRDGAQSDLEGMAAFDTNYDGQFDAQDEKWARFGIWQDANQNGMTDPGELRSLTQAGVQQVHLDSDGKFQIINGQTVHGMGSMLMTDGTHRAIADISLSFSAERQFSAGDALHGRVQTRTPATPFSQAGQAQTGTAGNDLILGQSGNDVIHSLAADDVIFDDGGNDLIDAGDGQDRVFSGADNDFIDGGKGDDVLYAGQGSDVVFGGDGNDAVFAEEGNDIIFGGSGEDLMAGGAGNDVLSGDDGQDQLFGETGNDALFGRAGDDLLLGMDGADYLDGGDGKDVLDGGQGADTLIGGLGDDTYMLDEQGDSITELADQGVDTIQTSLDSYTLGANLENLSMTAPLSSLSAKKAVGNALDNLLIGGAGDDQLIGGAGQDELDGAAGADQLIGGSGDDRYLVDNAEDQVLEFAGEGMDTVKAAISFSLSDQVEQLILTGSADLRGRGNALDNQLIGNSGNNWLDGAAGADRMAGGAGDDVYIVDDAGDSVIENAQQGNDTVRASISSELSAKVENLILTGTQNINGRGNALNNILSGNAGNNRLLASDGNDILNGGAGTDLLDGGTGNDTYRFNAGDGFKQIVDSAGADQISFGVGLNLDNLALRISADATGNHAELRVLDANGNEQAGQGVDFALASDPCGRLVSAISPIESFRFADGSTSTFEALQIKLRSIYAGARQITIRGDRNDDIIIGNQRDNCIDAGSGHDAINAGGGNDRIIAGGGNDFIAGGKGNDLIDAGAGHNVLAFNRNDGADTLVASAVAVNTLSLGHGIGLSDLSLRHVGQDLVLDIGRKDRLTLKDWYRSQDNHNLVTLQIVDDLRQKKHGEIATGRIDFVKVAKQFDAAVAIQPRMSAWSLMNAQLDAHLGTGDGLAIGGDLAFDYARTSSITLSQSETGAVLRQPLFGTVPQAHVGVLHGSYPTLTAA